MGLDIISIHISLSLTEIWQEHLFTHNGTIIYILNTYWTFSYTGNKHIHILHIFPFQ